MKRQLALALAIIFALLPLAACGQAAETETPETPSPATTVASDSPAEELEDEPTERITITMATDGDANYPFVSQFNSSQDKYIIEGVDYSQNGELDFDQMVIKLNSDFATGNAPDIIYFPRFRTEPEIYGRKGYLEDLYTYIDSDPELSRDELVHSLLKACEVDGKLYYTVPDFAITSIFVSKSLAESISEWDFPTMIELMENYDGPAFSKKFSGNSFLNSCIPALISEFVDYNTYTASFDSDYFKSVLEFCTALDSAPQREGTPLMYFTTIDSFMEPQYMEWLFGEESVPLGLPTESGGVNVINFFTSFAISINSASEHKDGAWECLRMLFTQEGQENRNANYLPSNLNALQNKIEYSKSTLYELDDDGNNTDVEYTDRGSVDGFPYHAATDDQVDMILELIDSPAEIYTWNYTIRDIVQEEASAYFSGAKTLDETANLIQSRVSLYLGEIS